MDGSGHRHHLRVSLGIGCLVLLVIGSVPSEASPACRTGCKGGSGQTFKYAIGTTYKYVYDGKIDISLSSAEGQSTTTEIKADVLLTQLPDCNQLLRLQNVQVLGQKGKKYGAIPDIEKPIRFNIHDGVIEDSICITDGDNQNSINVKRAIASLFQAPAKSGYETDIFGRCPTEVTSYKDGGVLVIGKSKSLNRCGFRENINQGFLSTAFNLESEIKSSPILNGDYNANLRIKNGLIDQVTVTEDYLFVPFSVGRNGAKAQVISKLEYKGTSKDAPQVAVTKPRSIIFDNPHPVHSPASNVQTILGAVRDVAKTIDIVVGETTAKEFINLLKIVRVSTKADLLAVYNQVKSGAGFGDKDAAKRVYLDALLRAGNGESVEAILELLDKKQLDEIDTKLALIGLNLVRHATEGSIKAVTHLLDSPQLTREAYLGIGNLVGRFCKQHDCTNVPEVKTVTAKLLTKIPAKFTTKEQENDAVYTLKGLANFQFVGPTVIPKITSLAQNKNLPSRLRVAALEAYLADPCVDKLRNSALQILQDTQQDSEVRIKAYLALAQCPNAKIGNAIKEVLVKEPSIQVGGFIASHIHAIRASANPDKGLAKQFLGFNIHKHFPIDPRKYSFNGEFSYAIDTLGLAASAETNVIYSQNSWLPRSTSLNLTAELFGHNVNFLEIETRQENVEHLIEHYLGPRGVLRKSLWSSLAKEGKTNVHEWSDYLTQKIKDTLHRSKRDITKAELDSIAKQVQIKTNELDKDLDVDVSVKAFGSEVFFYNVNKEEKLQPEKIIDSIITKLSQGLDKIQQFEETLRRNIYFLNAEIDYPTSLGFPLRLALEGSANVQLQASGAVDVRKLINNPIEGEVKAKIIPSVNVEVAGRLTLDALVVENGLKVISTLYTSSGADVRAFWDKSTVFDINWGLPVQEQKIVSASHEIVFVTREQSVRELNLPLKFTQPKDFSICFDQLSPFIGLTLCAEINGPNLGGKQVPILPFPLSGDAKAAVIIENNDVKEFRLKQILKPGHAALTLESIGKNNQQKAIATLEAEYTPEKYVRAIFNSAGKTAIAEAQIIITNVEKSLQVKFRNDKDEFSGKLGVTVSGTPERAIFKPLLEYKTPNGNQPLPITAEGQIIVEKNGDNVKYILDNVKISDTQRHMTISGEIGRDAGIFFEDIRISNGNVNLGLQGRLQIADDLLKFNIKVENNLNKNTNFNLKGELKGDRYHYDAAISLIHGPDLNSKTALLTITHSVQRKFKNPTDFRFSTKNSIKYPLWKINGKFDLEHTARSLDYDLNAEYGDLKIGSELEAKINEKTIGDYDIEFDLWGLDNKLEVKSRRIVLGNAESKISNSIELNGKKFELNGKLKHNIRPQQVDVGADLTVNIATRAVPYKVNLGLAVNSDGVDSHVKILSGSDPIVDLFIKGNKKGNVNGNAKINIKNVVTVNGKIQSINGAGSGDLLIDIQNGKRQVKGETTFTIILYKQVDIAATLYPSFNKDKNSKLTGSTTNKLTETSIDSRNSLNVLGHQLDVNGKGSRVGDYANGKFNGELEITLPGDKYILIKDDWNQQSKDELRTGASEGLLEYRSNKNSAGRKLNYKATWRNSNIKQLILDADLNLSADAEGKNLNFDLGAKSNKQGDVRDISVITKLTGNILNHPASLTLNGVNTGGHRSKIDISGSLGDANTFTGKADIDVSSPTKQGSLNFQLTSGSKQLTSLNVDLSGMFEQLQSKEMKLEGNVGVQANNAEGSIANLKSNGNINVGPLSSAVNVQVALNQLEPIGVKAGFLINDNKQGGSGNIDVTYGQKQFHGQASVDHIKDNEWKVAADIKTPFESYKIAHVNAHVKRNHQEGRADVDVTVDGKTWKSVAEGSLGELSSSVNLQLTNPEGKLQQFYAKGNLVSERHITAELKLINEPKSFVLDGDVTANVANIDNLLIKGHINAPTLNINKLVFEVHNKGSSADKKLQVSVQGAGKNVVNGQLTYTVQDDGVKLTVDASGTLKVKEESQSGNLKLTSEKLNTAEEQGVRIALIGSLGSKAVDNEFKLTNKKFILQSSYCEQKKECAFVEVESTIKVNEIATFDHVVEVNLDLRKLGLSNEFGLKLVTKRDGWLIDHSLDAHFQNRENGKYQYSLAIHPTDASLTLNTPKRIIALEGKLVPLKNWHEGGRTSGEIAFYLDKKNHAAKKTVVTWALNVDRKAQRLNGDAKFNHPGLKRPLSVSIRASREGTELYQKGEVVAELDVFAQENQKLVSTLVNQIQLDDARTKASIHRKLTVKSAGLGVNVDAEESVSIDRNAKELIGKYFVNCAFGKSRHESEISLKLSPSEQSGLIKLINKVLLKGVNRVQISDNDQLFETEIASYDNNPIVSRLEIKNFNTLSLNTAFKSQPDRRLIFNAGLVPSELADIRLQHQDGGKKTDLFFATVHLDEANFLKSQHKVDSKSIEGVLNRLKERSQTYFSGFETVSKEYTDSIKKDIEAAKELLKNAAPNLQALQSYYTKEWEEIKTEIANDKNIKEMREIVAKLFGSLFQVVSEFVEKLGKLVEQAAVVLENSFKGVFETIQGELLPQLNDIASKAFATTKSIVEEALGIALTVVAKGAEIIEKFQPEIQEFATMFGELFREVGQVVYKVYSNSADQVRAFINKILAEIKANTQLNEVKEHFERFIQQYGITKEQIFNAFREGVHTIKDMIPDVGIREDLYKFLDSIVDYIEKKLTNKQVDDVVALEGIGKNIIDILTKLYKDQSYPDLHVKHPTSANLLPVSFIKNLPHLVAIKFSPLSYALDEGLIKEIGKFLLSLINRPRNLVPPFPLFGLVIQSNVITFDGELVIIPGKCNYLLARDAVNGNFTVAGSFNNGVLAGITVADSTGSISVLEGGKVKFNQDVVELPFYKPTLSVFRDYETIKIHGSAGVLVECQSDLLGCVVRLSGFYHGQVRGILGNGNHEVFDDLTIPNGKVVTGESQFVNAYKLTQSCPDVTVPTLDKIPESAECNKLFSWDSSMRLCFPFIPTDKFKTACAQGLHSKVKNTEVAIAKAYVAACQDRHIPVNVPENLLQCTNSDKVFSVGDKFSVKLPSKAADIVLIVETSKGNQPLSDKLTKALINDVNNELHSKGIRDIEYHLITYGGENNKRPSHVTVNGKLTFKGKVPNIKFSENPASEEFGSNLFDHKEHQQVAQELEKLANDIRLAFGLTLKTDTYSAAYNYPFRAHALRSVIVVNEIDCERGRLSLLQEALALVYQNKQISLNLFTPLNSLTLKDGKKVKDVVGFNGKNVFTLSQAKKNPKGSSDLYRDLDYTEYCVDFTNRGNVFINNNFLSASDADQKQFIHVAAVNMVEQLINVEQGIDCECKLINPWHAINVCDDVFSKERASKKV